jgi:hypothetical protein
MERTTICGRKELRYFWGLKNAILLRRVRRSRRRPSWSGRRGLPIVTLTRDRPKYYVERHSASTGPHTVGRLATRCPHVITACLQYSQGHILIVRYGRIREDSFCHVWCCCAARLSMARVSNRLSRSSSVIYESSHLPDETYNVSTSVSRIEFLFSTCYARYDGPCEISHGLGAKTYPLLYWPATGLRRYHKTNLFSFISLHINIFGLQMVLMFVARSYLLRRKRVSGEITDFSHEQGCPLAISGFLCLYNFIY